MNFTVRDATEADIVGIDALRGKSPHDEQAQKRHDIYTTGINDPEQLVSVAVDDDTSEIVGWTHVERLEVGVVSHPGWYWRHILVAPGVTGAGIGNALGEEVVTFLTGKGATELYAVQRASGQARGMGFGLEAVDEPFEYPLPAAGDWMLYRAAPFHSHDAAKSVKVRPNRRFRRT